MNQRTIILIVRRPILAITALITVFLIFVGFVRIVGHLNHTMTPQPVNVKIAIVIDDFGIDNPGTQQMLELGIPITAAIMPNLLYSQKEAQLLHNLGYEIIIHMPIESKNGRPEWLGPGALTTNLSP